MTQIRQITTLLGATLLALSVNAAPSANEANDVLIKWQEQEARNLKGYLLLRGQQPGPNEDFDLHIDTKKIPMRPRGPDEIASDRATYQLVQDYYGHQGLDRFNGIFIESGAAYADGYQWNTHRWAGMKVKALRDKLLDRALENGIRNIRVGINVHEIDMKNPDTIEGILDFHREAWKRGIALTDSVLFFSGLKNLETIGDNGKVDPTRSYQNHPQFAAYSEKISDFVLGRIFAEQRKFNAENDERPANERKPRARTAINPVNEPETFAGFNHFWNGGHAKWSDPNVMRLYVPTIIQIARANVRIRIASDRAAKGERVLYFHNEAMTPKDYPSHHGDLQFAVSKLMLGDSQLMDADLAKLAVEPIDSIRQRFEQKKAAGTIDVVEASILKFSLIPANDTPQKVEAARAEIIGQLRDLKNDHLEYRKSGKNAKTDTILMLDYYQQGEFILPKKVPQMISEFSAKQGAALKRALNISDDVAFMKVLEERTRQAEKTTGQKLWPIGATRATLDFAALLSAEDAIVLEKVMGLRSDWTLETDALSTDRRKLVGFEKKNIDKTDEKRIDFLFNDVLKDDGKLLKQSLGVQTDVELKTLLAAAGADVTKGDLREILNQNERALFHSLFGLKRTRHTGFLPPHYARQIRSGMRKGFYEVFLGYVNELGLRVGGIGESGTPYYPWASLLHKQIMLQLVAAAKHANFYIVRNDIGPAVGTIGWMSGPMIKSLAENGKRGEDGVFKLVRSGPHQFDYQLSAWPGAKPWYLEYRNDFLNGVSPHVKAKPVVVPRTCKALF